MRGYSRPSSLISSGGGDGSSSGSGSGSATETVVLDRAGARIGIKYRLINTNGTDEGEFTVFDDDDLNGDFALADGTNLRGKFN